MAEEKGQVDDFEDDLEALPAEDIEVVVDDTDTDVEVEAEAPAEEEVHAEAEETPAPVAETDDDADDAALPEKIKKRFQREKRLRDQIIGERDQIRQAAEQAVIQSRQKDDEIVTLRKQYAAVQRQYADTLDFAYDQSIQIKSQALRKAREDGDLDAETKIQSELDAFRFQQNQIRDAKRTLPDPDKIQAPQSQAASTPAPQAQQSAPPPPLAVKWLDANKPWFNSPKFQGHRAFVLAEDSKLVREGYDKNSPEYYAELDRRVDEAFPTLRKKPKAPTKSPVAGVGAAPAKHLSKNTVRLTRVDLGNMRRFGLDPTNKEHLREYARNKQHAASAE